MIIQVKKRSDGQVELLGNGKSLAVLTKPQAETLSLALKIAIK